MNKQLEKATEELIEAINVSCGIQKMTTWTYSNSNVAIVVTADSVDFAIALVMKQLLDRGYTHYEVKSEDLIPLPTHHRYARTIYNAEEW